MVSSGFVVFTEENFGLVLKMIKWPFLGGIEFKCTTFTCILVREIKLKCLDQMFRCSEMLWLSVFWWFGWKNSGALRKWCWVGLCSKVESAVGFSGKHFFKCVVSFHLEMFDVTNFRQVLVVYDIHLVIFIQKYLV